MPSGENMVGVAGVAHTTLYLAMVTVPIPDQLTPQLVELFFDFGGGWFVRFLQAATSLLSIPYDVSNPDRHPFRSNPDTKIAVLEQRSGNRSLSIFFLI
jgi:hypothetical protein